MWYDFKSVVLRVNRFIRIHFQVQYTCVKMLWDKYYENIVLDMNEIDFERFYKEFDLGEFLMEAVGSFDREDLKLIFANVRNISSISVSSRFYGIRGTMAKELERIRNDSNWYDKAHYICEKDAMEICFRLYLIEKLKRDFKLEDE